MIALGSLGLLSLGTAPYAHAQYPGFDDPGSSSGTTSGGGLVPSSPTIDGGAIPLGATAQVVVLFRNDGGLPIETGLIRLYPSSTVSANVSMNQCEEEPLSSGAECAIALSVKGLQPGQWRVEMLMSHSGRTRLVTSTISGTVETSEGAGDELSSDIDAIPSDVDFGSLANSQALVEPVILRNITSNPIELTNIYLDTATNSGYSVNANCPKLEAGQACIATITWSPKLKGRSSGVLVIEHTGPTGISSIPLKGEYAPENVVQAEIFPQAVPGRGLLVSSQSEIDFGNDISTASAITVSLVNSGDSDLTLNDIRSSGSDNGISFKEGGCSQGMTLEPIEACPLTVTWSPTRVGEVLDDIQILHDGARGVLVIPIMGESVATVSQDQKAIMLSGDGNMQVFSSDERDNNGDINTNQANAAARNKSMVYKTANGNINPAGVLDGYKITSFSPTRAIINGPGGSRIVYDNEESVLGGIPWMVLIQKNGIEFTHQGQRILLLFDRSLSSLNRVTAEEDSDDVSSGSDTASE
ncbi:MAG: choice-of-anchor D domain-containing protein [Micavibrio sp.]|nr:choice-of-anchor D domain-containing protein [Micavibrio sp.]